MAQQQEQAYSQADYMLSDLNARTRILEGKNSLFNERLLIINQNMLNEYKKIIQEIKNLEQETKALKQDLFKVRNTLRHMSTELNFFARKENVKVLEKYINMWNPLNFITKEEVLEIIKEEGDKKDGRSK